MIVDEYAPCDLNEGATGVLLSPRVQRSRGKCEPEGRSLARAVPHTPAPSLRACDGCGTDLDEDGACPCCEGARA